MSSNFSERFFLGGAPGHYLGNPDAVNELETPIYFSLGVLL